MLDGTSTCAPAHGEQRRFNLRGETNAAGFIPRQLVGVDSSLLGDIEFERPIDQIKSFLDIERKGPQDYSSGNA